MELNFKEIATISMILFAVIDVVGSLPVLLDLQQKVGKIQSEKATLVSGVIMIAFMFVGEQILSLIGIDVSSFAIACSVDCWNRNINNLAIITCRVSPRKFNCCHPY
jgi:multiple antibiotic resistance protein